MAIAADAIAAADAAGAQGGAPPAHPLPPPAAAKRPHPPDGGGDPALDEVAPPQGAPAHDAALEVLRDGSAAARWRGALISPGCAGRGALVSAPERPCQPWRRERRPRGESERGERDAERRERARRERARLKRLLRRRVQFEPRAASAAL